MPPPPAAASDHVEEHAHAGERPLDPRVLVLELRGEDLLSEARLGCVDGALVRVLHLCLVDRDSTH
eukprot:356754-Chlamydomonas_euryale.AAC.4